MENDNKISRTNLRLVAAAKDGGVQNYFNIFYELVETITNKYCNSVEKQRVLIEESIRRSLAVAVDNGKVDIMTRAIEELRSVYPGDYWIALMARASVFGRLDIAILLTTNDTPYHHKKYFLFEAAKRDEVELFTRMLTTYLPNFHITTEVNAYGKSVFVEAMDYGAEKVVLYIVDELQYDIECRDYAGRTPFLNLVAHGHAATYIPNLIAMGVDVDAVDNEGSGAIDIINKRLEHPRQEIIPALLAIKKCLTE